METGQALAAQAALANSWLAALRREHRPPRSRSRSCGTTRRCRAGLPSRGRSSPDPRLRRVIDYLHGSFGEEISLDGLAAVAGLSPNYFLHAFKRTTGRTPHRYLTELRIAKACEHLRNPHRSIADISLAVGFSSQSHLTTVFRRFMMTTPAAYREEVLGLRHNPNGEPGLLGHTDGLSGRRPCAEAWWRKSECVA